MDAVLFLLHIRGLKPLLVFYLRVEENVAKFHSQWILFSREVNFAQNLNSRKLTPREKLVFYSRPMLLHPLVCLSL